MVIDTVTQPPWEEGILPSNRLMGCAAGWGRIFTTGLTIKGFTFIGVTRMGSHIFGIWGIQVGRDMKMGVALGEG